MKSKNAVVYGINPGSAESHKKFIDKNRLEFPLLVDSGQNVARLYSANGLFVKRTVYLIGPDGMILLGTRGMPSPLEILKHAK